MTRKYLTIIFFNLGIKFNIEVRVRHFFKNQNSDEIIVFFCGWGMDEKPFLPLKSESDILYIYDYNDLELNFDFSKYKKKTLVTYSCGVFMAYYLKDILPDFDLKVAINGTLKPFDEKFGVTKERSKIFENISKENYLYFREKLLLQNKKELTLFNKYQPKRSLESSLLEFANLKKYAKNRKEEDFFYDKILISEEDKIIPPDFQKKFWKKNYKTISGAHFPFYKFNSIEEMINC